jgi:hypothetical protein
MINHSKLLTCISTWIFICCVHAQDVFQENLSKIERGSASDVYAVLNRFKISTFSTDKLIKDGLSEEELRKWQDVTRAANSFARADDPSRAADITVLQQVEDFIVNTVAQLHAVYGKAFKIYNPGKKEWSFDLAQVKNSNGDVNLTEIQQKAKKYLEKINNFINQVFEQMGQEADYPLSWTKNIPDKSEVIYPQYKELYADWLLAQKRTPNGMSDKEFNLFMRQHGIMDEKSAMKLLPKLEQLSYRLEQKGTSFFARKEKKMAPAFKEMAQRLKRLYPDMPLSMLTSTRLAETKDKSAMIILGQADAMQGALKRLLLEVTALIQATEK